MELKADSIAPLIHTRYLYSTLHAVVCQSRLLRHFALLFAQLTGFRHPNIHIRYRFVLHIICNLLFITGLLRLMMYPNCLLA